MYMSSPRGPIRDGPEAPGASLPRRGGATRRLCRRGARPGSARGRGRGKPRAAPSLLLKGSPPDAAPGRLRRRGRCRGGGATGARCLRAWTRPQCGIGNGNHLFSIHGADVRTEEAQLLHSCSHSPPQKESLPVPPATTLVGVARIILKHACRASHTIVLKRRQSGGRCTCFSAALVVELRARTSETRPLVKGNAQRAPKNTLPPHKHTKRLLDMNTTRGLVKVKAVLPPVPTPPTRLGHSHHLARGVGLIPHDTLALLNQPRSHGVVGVHQHPSQCGDPESS